jgi:hypothetical protein
VLQLVVACHLKGEIPHQPVKKRVGIFRVSALKLDTSLGDDVVKMRAGEFDVRRARMGRNLVELTSMRLFILWLTLQMSRARRAGEPSFLD